MKFSSYNQFNDDLAQVGIDYAVKHAKACGFSGVELLDSGLSPNGRAAFSDLYDIKALKKALEQNGLSVACYSAYADIYAEDWLNIKKKIERMIDTAAFLGSPLFHHTIIPHFQFYIPDSPPYESFFDSTVQYIGEIADACEKKGITCIYEPQGFYFNGIEGLGRLIDAVSKTHSNIGFCADMGNSLCVDENPSDVFAALGVRTRQVHIKDFLVSDEPIGGKVKYQSKKGKYLYTAPLFCGSVQIEACFSAIKASGYDGFFSFEFLENDSTAKELMKKLQAIWEII